MGKLGERSRELAHGLDAYVAVVVGEAFLPRYARLAFGVTAEFAERADALVPPLVLAMPHSFLMRLTNSSRQRLLSATCSSSALEAMLPCERPEWVLSASVPSAEAPSPSAALWKRCASRSTSSQLLRRPVVAAAVQSLGLGGLSGQLLRCPVVAGAVQSLGLGGLSVSLSQTPVGWLAQPRGRQ